MKHKTRSAKSMVMQTQYASKTQKDRTKYKRKAKWDNKNHELT